MKIIENYFQDLLKILNGRQLEYQKWFMETGQMYTNISTGYPLRHTVEQKGCFKNSTIYHIADGLTYVEGLYVTDNVPIALEHAFNLDQDGNVVDTTAMKFKIPVKEYFGIVIPKDILREYILDDNIPDFVSPLQYYYKTLKEK